METTLISYITDGCEFAHATLPVISLSPGNARGAYIGPRYTRQTASATQPEPTGHRKWASARLAERSSRNKPSKFDGRNINQSLRNCINGETGRRVYL